MNEFEINSFERKVYSQNGEDGIIDFIFTKIGTTNKFFVEFGVVGVEDELECNTKYLMEKKGWKGLMMDSNSQSSSIKKEKITAENVETVFQKYDVPKTFDLLSIDVDSNDYWIWRAIKNYHPQVVVIEYNAHFPPNESKVVDYDPSLEWDGTTYFGASLLALKKLGEKKDYILVGCDNNGVNAFFCKKELVQDIMPKRSIEELYRPPRFGQIVDGKFIGHPQSSKKMIDI